MSQLPLAARVVTALILACPSAPLAFAQAAPSWLTADSVTRTATLALTVTPSADPGSALINGHREGGVMVVVPVGWTVVWDWRNADSVPHSLVVMAEREKLPTEGGRPVFTNAMTRSVTDGLAPGQTDHTTFEADQAGWYWLLCGVPEHAIRGEWIGLKVDAEAKSPGLDLRETRNVKGEK